MVDVGAAAEVVVEGPRTMGRVRDVQTFLAFVFGILVGKVDAGE
jgi:hypothetical protein